jgi:aryl-alcohol dehydrogenase-like predicted oxidoreductase
VDRREFIRTTVAAGLAQGVGGPALADSAPVPRRPLGKTGVELSIIGFGGIVVMDKAQEQADRSVARAVERGINYFDVAPTYGNAQDRLGPALQPYRPQAFLACKTTQRLAEGARSELEGSLRVLRTDHFDLYQLHALSTMDDVDRAFGPGGAMEALVKARQEGKVRFLGFSAHGVEAAMAAMDRFDFDTTLFPINYVLWTGQDFGPQAIARARDKKMGILALKALCRGQWPEGAERTHPPCWYQPVTDREEGRLALGFALSQGATAVLPPGNGELFWMAVDLAGQARPLQPGEEERLAALAAGATPLFEHRPAAKG